MYAFIHIPKTAGTTLRFLLRRAFGAQHCDVRSPVHCRQSTPWLTASSMRLVKAVYPKLLGVSGHRVSCFTDLHEPLPDVKFFTFMRDPVKRMISGFQNKYYRLDQCTVENLERFVADPNNRNMQTRWICGQEDAEQAINVLNSQIGLVGLTEKFDESLILLKHWLNQPQFEINYESRNVTPVDNLLPYQDSYINSLLVDANQHDIALYDHVIEKVFPAQINAYGPAFDADLSVFKQQQADFKDLPEPVWGRAKRNLIYKPLLHLPWV